MKRGPETPSPRRGPCCPVQPRLCSGFSSHTGRSTMRTTKALFLPVPRSKPNREKMTVRAHVRQCGPPPCPPTGAKIRLRKSVLFWKIYGIFHRSSSCLTSWLHSYIFTVVHALNSSLFTSCDHSFSPPAIIARFHAAAPALLCAAAATLSARHSASSLHTSIWLGSAPTSCSRIP